MTAGPQYNLPDLAQPPAEPCTGFSVGVDDAKKDIPVPAEFCLGDLIRIPGNI